MRTHHHHPLWPHSDRDWLLNPFAPVTQRSPIFDRVEFVESEEEEAEGPQDPAVEQTDLPSPARQ
jgi:hypothetical protein